MLNLGFEIETYKLEDGNNLLALHVETFFKNSAFGSELQNLVLYLTYCHFHPRGMLGCSMH